MTMSIGYRTLSQHLNDLKKENFSLKLRIYFLEERIQHKYEDSNSDVSKSNIECKVEAEGLTQEHMEMQLPEKAWVDCGHLNSCNELEFHLEYKQRQEEAKHAQELLEKQITFLQEDVRLATIKADRMSALAETEKENCLKLKKTIEGFTADMTEARLLQKNYCTILAEKDRMIQKMTLLLDNKDSAINQLTEKNKNLIKHQIKDMEKCMYELQDALQQKENEIKNLSEKKAPDATQYETLLSQQAQNLHKLGMEVQALQEKLQESKDIIKTLQESQHQLTINLNNAEELTHNQDSLLQSLRDSLQSRDNEVMELYQILDEHNATIAKLQDMLLKSQNEQLQTFQVMPTQLQFLELQNTLFCTQIELQKKQIALRQKERQLTDVKRSQKLLEVDLLEGQQQKETTWKHNQDLHGALHKLQRELQEKIQHLKNLEEEKCTKLFTQEHSIERLKQTVSQKEQILQEYIDVLHYQPSLERVQGGNEHMIQKLQQRIKERDAALEKAVDDKFCALEEKEKEIQRLKMIVREREYDLERLSNVLSGNEETINSLDSLVKAKDMEVDQISAAYKNLQWLKQETEEKYRCSLNERESIIQQLQKNLQERNKEMEVSSEKIYQMSSCQNCLQKEHNTGVNQYVENLSNFIHLQKLVQEKEKIIQTLMKSCSVPPMVISMKSEDLDAKGEETENNKALTSDLAKAKEDLRLVLRKMREYQLEVSVLQSIIMKQNEQLHEQATDIYTLTRKNLMKEELIKDLQVNLADPEEIPTVELLTQQIFTLKENIATLNSTSHGHLPHTQKIFKFLEELAANKSRLNEALQAEKQLYSCLIQFHTETDSSSSALHNELLAVQTLRGQLEDTLMRTMERLVTLQSESKVPACFGGGVVKYDTKKIHMDFQDLGYETCGKSENEIDREETSPECEEDGDFFTEINMIQKDCDDQYCSPMTSMTPAKNKGFWHTDQKSDVNVPKQHVKKLKSHLQTSKKLLQQLQSQSCLFSKCHGFTEDDGWQSDTTYNSYTILEQLAKRVSKLESYIYYFQKDAGIQCSLKSVTIPGKYDWLIQAQARELSLLRQKVGEGQKICNILTQHLDEGLKSFEEMLRANDIDYFMGQSFRQHLFQVNQLAKKLNSKLDSNFRGEIEA